jgi:hypothetical protein
MVLKYSRIHEGDVLLKAAQAACSGGLRPSHFPGSMGDSREDQRPPLQEKELLLGGEQSLNHVFGAYHSWLWRLQRAPRQEIRRNRMA